MEALIDIEQNIQGTNFSPFNRQARDDPTETIDWETVASSCIKLHQVKRLMM